MNTSVTRVETGPREPTGSPERGSAIAEAVFVIMLIVLLIAALFQLVFALYVRNVVIDAAHEGARYGALIGNTGVDGAARTRTLISSAVSPSYASNVSATTTPTTDGDVIEVTVHAPLPIIGPFGPDGALSITGRAIVETVPTTG